MKELFTLSEFNTALIVLAFLITSAGFVLRFFFNRYAAGYMMIFAGPLLYLTWKAYNALTDHFGLDSLQNYYINILIFALIGALFGAVSSRFKHTKQKDA